MNLFTVLFCKNKFFVQEEFEETQISLVNPSRGWYKVFNFSIEEEPDFEYVKTDLLNDDRLALVLIDIAACRKDRITDEYLERIDKILQFFAENDKEVILRVAYDHTGNAMEREPSFFDHVLEHVGQISDVIKRNSDKIYIFQGILLGNWGEMHGSRFLEYDKIRKLAERLEGEKPKGLFMAVRKPSQWRMIRNIKTDGSLPEPSDLGIFNDGMFGSENDLGTYGNGSREQTGWSSAWSRNNELEFQNKLCRVVPNGGEAIFNESFLTIAGENRYIDELRVMHVTYLNREHDSLMLDYWRKHFYRGKGIWKGSSLYDYIGAHLGYRFIVRKAEMEKLNSKEYKLKIYIENTGFANIYRPCMLMLEYNGKKGVVSVPIDYDLRTCIAGEISECSVVIMPCKGEIYLSAYQKKDRVVINFANVESDNGRVRIGRFIG